VRSKGWRVEAVLTALVTVVMMVGGGVAVWILTTKREPIHENAAGVRSTPAAAASARYAGAAEDSRRLARAVIVGDELPGLSLAVAVDGEIVWAEGFGWADVESRTPMTPVTRFRLGALSKPVTAVGAAALHDRGRLDLDAPVQQYVPAYPQKQWTVTTRQLMSDVAGVHRIRGDNNDAMPTAHCGSLDEAVALLTEDPLLFEPGTQHRYSIWGWVLVSAAVEGASGEPFNRFMARQVFAPLGMERTVTAEREDLDGVAHGAGRRPDYSCLAGGGAFLSTPTDLVRLGSAMLTPGLLRADTIAAFATPARLVSGASTTYALGWTVKTIELAGQPTRIVSHRGSPAGGTVSLLTFPDVGVAIAAAANRADARGVDPLARQAAEAFIQQRQSPPARTRTISINLSRGSHDERRNP
jgi:serine beta-lactamase-like protein LACTB, mitochondrial